MDPRLLDHYNDELAHVIQEKPGEILPSVRLLGFSALCPF